MHVTLSGWFAGQTVGSGRYTDRLLAALGDDPPSGWSCSLALSPQRRDPLTKLAYEQFRFPRLAARGGGMAHVPYWAPPLRPRGPTVVTVHDLIPLLLPEYRRRWRERAYSALAAAGSRRAGALIADSVHTAADIALHLAVAPERIHVVPLGVEAAFRPPTPDQLLALGARLSLPARYGLYLGGFDTRKNLAILLTAWRVVHAAGGPPLLIAGRLPRPDDPFAPHPATLARAAGLPDGAWQALGPVAEADLPTLLGGAAVFAFPSRYEGFGLPPLEAMACGAPVVAARASSLPEVVGDAGLLVDAVDAVAWAAALGRVLTDPDLATGLRAAGLRRAGGFTWQRAARATWAVYQRVAEGRVGPAPVH
ncbi:MAG: glycosyltransferase family 4 protein [Ardenticatenia bacterium]|nr:glycosyltransferase family 4 protein [Ardenticatenia bacterium]